MFRATKSVKVAVAIFNGFLTFLLNRNGVFKALLWDPPILTLSTFFLFRLPGCITKMGSQTFGQYRRKAITLLDCKFRCLQQCPQNLPNPMDRDLLRTKMRRSMPLNSRYTTGQRSWVILHLEGVLSDYSANHRLINYFHNMGILLSSDGSIKGLRSVVVCFYTLTTTTERLG